MKNFCLSFARDNEGTDDLSVNLGSDPQTSRSGTIVPREDVLSFSPAPSQCQGPLLNQGLP